MHLPPIAHPTGDVYLGRFRHHLARLAFAQRKMLTALYLMIGCSVIFFFLLGMNIEIPAMVYGPLVGGFLLLGIWELWAVYRLSRLLRMGQPILCVLTCLMPFVGLVTVLLLSREASSRLRDTGVRMGAMGANLQDLRQESASA